MQVLDNIDTKERETRAFVKLNNFIPDSKCILITNSEEAPLNCDGIEIDVVPVWKWLLEGEGKRKSNGAVALIVICSLFTALFILL